jgi:hypothetical protein
VGVAATSSAATKGRCSCCIQRAGGFELRRVGRSRAARPKKGPRSHGSLPNPRRTGQRAAFLCERRPAQGTFRAALRFVRWFVRWFVRAPLVRLPLPVCHVSPAMFALFVVPDGQ